MLGISRNMPGLEHRSIVDHVGAGAAAPVIPSSVSTGEQVQKRLRSP